MTVPSTTPESALAKRAPATLSFSTDILAGQLAPSSIAVYRRDVAQYLVFAATTEAALQPATLARWRTHMAQNTRLSPRTINRYGWTTW